MLKRKIAFSETAQESSYLVVELIAQKSKGNTIVKNTIMPTCTIQVSKSGRTYTVSGVEKGPLSLQ